MKRVLWWIYVCIMRDWLGMIPEYHYEDARSFRGSLQLYLRDILETIRQIKMKTIHEAVLVGIVVFLITLPFVYIGWTLGTANGWR
jgi:hypothetical protein